MKVHRFVCVFHQERACGERTRRVPGLSHCLPRAGKGNYHGHYLIKSPTAGCFRAKGQLGADRLSEGTEKVKTGICVCDAIGPKDRAERTRSSLITVNLILQELLVLEE